MADKCLPNDIRPFKIAHQSERLAGQMDSASMERLKSLVVEAIQPFKVILEGGQDAQGYHFLRCFCDVTLKLTCQRCLEPVRYLIQVDAWLVPVRSQFDHEPLPDYYDPLPIHDKITSLSDLVEDELLLRLPVVALHNEDQCPKSLPSEVREAGESSQRHRPFANLKQRLNQKNQEE